MTLENSRNEYAKYMTQDLTGEKIKKKKENEENEIK